MTQEEFNTVSTGKKNPWCFQEDKYTNFCFSYFLLISCFNSLSQRWQSYWWKLMCNFKILYYQCEWVIPWWLCEFIYIRLWKCFFSWNNFVYVGFFSYVFTVFLCQNLYEWFFMIMTIEMFEWDYWL